MSVANIMTRKVISVSPNITVKEMLPMFKQFGIHHLLVVQDHALVGMVSDRDVLKTLSPFANTQVETEKDAFTLGRTANQIMSKQLVTVESKSGIRAACDILLSQKVSLLPVLEDGQLVGVLSWKDILRHFID